MVKQRSLYAVIGGTLEASWPDEVECEPPIIAARENRSCSVMPVRTSANMTIGSNKPYYECFGTTVNDVSSPVYLAGSDTVDACRSARGSSVALMGATRDRSQHFCVKLLGASKVNLGEESGILEHNKQVFSLVGFPRQSKASLLDVSDKAMTEPSSTLSQKKSPSDFGDTAAPYGATPMNSPWCAEKDARRCELIDKKIQGTLKSAESRELAELQVQALAYFDRIAPPPLEGARRLHSRLIEKASQQPDT